MLFSPNSTAKFLVNPIIADLDNDGYQDLLLSDHGFSIKLYWNNNRIYGKCIDLIVGDTHGIAIGDFNKDGVTDVLVSRGGGSGDNARNAKLFHINIKEK
nr:VCBS repeat-containing protein [Colwellia maritima]